MEGHVVQVNDLVNRLEQHAAEQSLSPDGSDVSDSFGDPTTLPRVGEQYQVEIPPLMSKSDYLLSQGNTHDAEIMAYAPHGFLVGLPIPLIWIKDEVEIKKHKQPEGSQNILDSRKSNSKHEVMDSSLGGSGNSNMQKETKIEMQENHEGKGYCLVPGSSSDTWNEREEAGIILGLYIFEKNLVQVKRFIGNRNMGDILSFYYGKFYKSGRYQRWSEYWVECKNSKGKKNNNGQKIFTGARQQELLSRLLPSVSEECCKKLFQVSKTFSEGKMGLEDYVLTLKASVGLSALVEAVGIGKGKEDLTVLAADSLKSTQTVPARPEVPVGKACSVLTPAEIIAFLRGDFRLSKARSSDLFWEAVWPRLLARGWHSEQPGSHNYALASKNSLVFLVPGVKKFSRKLLKGNHYFDSVSDVLGKVASDPELIELESLADNDCTSTEGYRWTKETKQNQEHSSDQQRHCYLKPRSPNHSMDVMKFTVVDTSLAGEKTTKVRELRSLPDGVLASTSEKDSDDDDTSEEHTNESESTNTLCFDRESADITKATKGNMGREVPAGINGFKNNPSREELLMGGTGSTNLSVASKDKKADLLGNTCRKIATKCQSSTRGVPQNDILVPVTKRRRRLTACSRAERNCNTASIFVAPKVKQELFCCHYISNASVNVLSQEVPPQENKVIADPLSQEKKILADPPFQRNKIIADPLLDASSNMKREAVPATNSSHHEDRHEKTQKRTMIDLNLPVTPEVEADEPFPTEMTDRQQNNTKEDRDNSLAATISKPVDNSEQSNVNTRRQSTRNRPLTAKVLEAFAFGYLDNRKEKRRSRDYPQDSLASRPSQRARGKKTGETSSSSGADVQREESANAVCNSNGDVSSTGFKSNEG